MGEWVSVKDRLPEHTRRYLAFIPNMGECIGTYSCLHSQWLDCGGVSHWTDLPDTPPEPQLTVKDALREAIDALERITEVHNRCRVTGTFWVEPEDILGRPLLPRLRAALEAE